MSNVCSIWKWHINAKNEMPIECSPRKSYPIALKYLLPLRESIMAVPLRGFSLDSSTRTSAFVYKWTASYKYAASARICNDNRRQCLSWTAPFIALCMYTRCTYEPVLHRQTIPADLDNWTVAVPCNRSPANQNTGSSQCNSRLSALCARTRPQSIPDNFDRDFSLVRPLHHCHA